jgi:hypothetical protein
LGGLSHAALVQPLDTSGRFQIEVGLNSQGQVVAHLTARSGTWKNVDPTFTQTMKEGLSVDMGGTRVPVMMTAGVGAWEGSLFDQKWSKSEKTNYGIKAIWRSNTCYFYVLIDFC